MTIASATSGTVSETRAIGAPTLSTVERPTSRSTSVGVSTIGAGPAVGVTDATKAGDGCCAWGVATRMTMMATTSAANGAGLPCVARRKRRKSVVYPEVMFGPLKQLSAISDQRF